MDRTRKLLTILLFLWVCLALLTGAALADGSVGWQWVDGGWAYYRDDGSRVTNDWLSLEGKWYCIINGHAITGGTYTVNGSTYYFDENGVMQTGWQWADGGWSYFQSGGARMESGWLKSNGSWYYIENGHALTSKARTIGSYTYYFNESGAMQTGWQYVDAAANTKDESGWSFFYSDGTRFNNGWMKRSGKWYCFVDGVMQTGIVKLDDGTYFCNEDGVMQTGWVWLTAAQNGTEAAGWSRFNTSGRQLDGWNKINGTWYYFVNGVMQTGWQLQGGNWYYLNNNGSMYTGWMKAGSDWYYMDTNGKMRVGWKNVSGYTYYFYNGDNGPIGVMATNCEIDGYAIDGSGHASMSVSDRNWYNAQGYESPTDYLIAVDYTNCVIGVFQRGEGKWDRIRYEYCSPGAYSTPTYRGVFYIYDQGYYFDSGSARCYYYSTFNGNQAMHSILYYQTGGVMTSSLGYHLSHGCVRLATATAKWIYDNCPIGTTVIIYS